MKNVRKGGLQELRSFKNRLGRGYGRGEINKAEHDRLSEKTEDLIKEVDKLDLPIEEEE
jgi:hypothetical protein